MKLHKLFFTILLFIGYISTHQKVQASPDIQNSTFMLNNFSGYSSYVGLRIGNNLFLTNHVGSHNDWKSAYLEMNNAQRFFGIPTLLTSFSNSEYDLIYCPSFRDIPSRITIDPNVMLPSIGSIVYLIDSKGNNLSICEAIYRGEFDFEGDTRKWMLIKLASKSAHIGEPFAVITTDMKLLGLRGFRGSYPSGTSIVPGAELSHFPFDIPLKTETGDELYPILNMQGEWWNHLNESHWNLPLEKRQFNKLFSTSEKYMHQLSWNEEEIFFFNNTNLFSVNLKSYQRTDYDISSTIRLGKILGCYQDEVILYSQNLIKYKMTDKSVFSILKLLESPSSASFSKDHRYLAVHHSQGTELIDCRTMQVIYMDATVLNSIWDEDRRQFILFTSTEIKFFDPEHKIYSNNIIPLTINYDKRNFITYLNKLNTVVIDNHIVSLESGHVLGKLNGSFLVSHASTGNVIQVTSKKSWSDFNLYDKDSLKLRAQAKCDIGKILEFSDYRNTKYPFFLATLKNAVVIIPKESLHFSSSFMSLDSTNSLFQIEHFLQTPPDTVTYSNKENWTFQLQLKKPLEDIKYNISSGPEGLTISDNGLIHFQCKDKISFGGSANIEMIQNKKILETIQFSFKPPTLQTEDRVCLASDEIFYFSESKIILLASPLKKSITLISQPSNQILKSLQFDMPMDQLMKWDDKLVILSYAQGTITVFDPSAVNSGLNIFKLADAPFLMANVDTIGNEVVPCLRTAY
jgi:hypothetical protein